MFPGVASDAYWGFDFGLAHMRYKTKPNQNISMIDESGAWSTFDLPRQKFADCNTIYFGLQVNGDFL